MRKFKWNDATFTVGDFCDNVADNLDVIVYAENDCIPWKDVPLATFKGDTSYISSPYLDYAISDFMVRSDGTVLIWVYGDKPAF